jgi:hyaluronate lyase
MPGASATTAAERAAAASWLAVLANSGNQQGVSVPSLGVTAVNFWKDGTVGAVTADQPCSVLIREQRGAATICVSDPSRVASSVVVTWNRPATSVASADLSVTVMEREGRLRLRIAVGDTAGATHKCVVAPGGES